MCLGNKPYQCSVIWDGDENLVHFKCRVPSTTKREDVKVEIDEHGKLLIEISKGVSSHSDPLSSASSLMIRFRSFLLSFLKKNEGDTTSPIGPMEFNLPAGLNTNDFETAIDDEGLLTLTFKKLVPIRAHYQRSVFWDEDENLVHFNYRLPSGTKREDVKVEIDEDGKLLITIISKVAGAHTDSSMIISSLFSFLNKKEGDTTSQIIRMEFNLPAGLNTNGFETAIVDEGLLTLTFKKLVEWKNKKRVFHFKAYLPAGTKMNDMTVGIEGRKSLVIGIHDRLKKEEGDTSTSMCFNGKNFGSFILPDGVNPNGFKSAMDDDGVLTVIFTKLKPEKKKLGPIAKKTLGCLADAAGMLICGEISDAICPGDC
ncbi:hypothetical protein AB3S75_039830 [Citrus x aurantiifolia]